MVGPLATRTQDYIIVVHLYQEKKTVNSGTGMAVQYVAGLLFPKSDMPEYSNVCINEYNEIYAAGSGKPEVMFQFFFQQKYISRPTDR